MKYILTYSIVLLFIGMTIAPVIGFNLDIKSNVSRRGGITLYVGGSGPGNYTRIQDAIDDASNGDTVIVFDDSSPYYENVVVDKSIYLIGEDRNSTVIDGNGNGDVVYVSVDWVTISEFTIQNSGVEWDDAGIEISSKYTTITGNIIISNNRNGIYLIESSNNIITDNTISNNSDGIELVFSGNNTITGNVISNNDGPGIRSDYSSNNTITGNTITLNHHRGIYLWVSSRNKIMDNTISNNYDGIILVYNNIRNIITGNNITNNGIGIFLRDSYINTITGNTISNNMDGGIWLSASSNTTIYHNNFINNTQNANDTDENNTWDNGYPSCGNYWSDYSDVDNYSGPNQNIPGPDGVGDTPYDLPFEHATDRYPLMEPYGMTKLTMSIKKGLLKFSGGIKNIGNKTAFNVQWKIAIDGGFILLGWEFSGTIPKPLLSGEETTVSSGIVFGFGPIMITVAVWADNAPLVSGTISGFLLLFFIKINPGGGI